MSAFSAKPMALRHAGTPGTPPAFFWNVALPFFRLRYLASCGLLQWDGQEMEHNRQAYG